MNDALRGIILFMVATKLAGECEAEDSSTLFEWAVNVGGPDYTGADGTRYVAEEFVSGGEVGVLDEILRSQDPQLYVNFREGDFLYGHFVVRAKLPRGMGTWPAIWMLPSDPFTYATTCSDEPDWQGSADCDAWAACGDDPGAVSMMASFRNRCLLTTCGFTRGRPSRWRAG